MQDYAKLNRQFPRSIIILLLVLFVAYLPLTSFLFSLKNDAFTGYFPPKFFMSESLHAGHLPMWNPYINYGLPQYGDMSSGFWSPITWLIAVTVGYNVYSFTLELLLYLFLAGIGVYLIGKMYKLLWQVSIIAGISYMCCGYMVGHLQHFNWISGAAFLPLCMWAYLRIMHNSTVKNMLLAVLIFYFFISSAHPGIVIAAFYFFFLLAVFTFLLGKKEAGTKIGSLLKPHFFLIGGLLLLSTGMIIGYADILPFFVRSQKIPLQSALSNATGVTSYLSFIFPFATVKNNLLFRTDISMRNCYIGILLLPFLLNALLSSKTQIQKWLLGIGCCFLLLSAGGIFKTVAYYLLPGIGYVRLNGEFRIFALLSFVVVSALELNKFFTSTSAQNRKLYTVFFVSKIICCLVFGYALFSVLTTKETILCASFNDGGSLSNNLKLFLDGLTWYDTLLVQSVIQFIILTAGNVCLKKRALNFLLLLCIADVTVATLLNVPFTGVGKMSPASLQRIFSGSPKGVPKPELMPISKIAIPENYTAVTGHWSMYNKQIGVTEQVPYPILLKGMESYFLRISNGDSALLAKPFVFVSPAIAAEKIELIQYSGQAMELIVTTNAASQLIIQQNAYPHWITTQPTQTIKQANEFISVPLKKGTQKVNITFEPTLVKFGLVFSAFCFLVFLGLFLFLSFKSAFPL